MILSVSVPDETFALYAERNKANPAKEMAKQLELFKDVHAGADRALLVHGDARREIEGAAQRTFGTSEELAKWAKELKTLEIAKLEFPLSEGQLKRAHQNAKFFKQPIEQFIAQKVKRALEVEFGL